MENRCLERCRTGNIRNVECSSGKWTEGSSKFKGEAARQFILTKKAWLASNANESDDAMSGQS